MNQTSNGNDGNANASQLTLIGSTIDPDHKQSPFHNYPFMKNIAAFNSNGLSILINFVLQLYVNLIIFEVILVFKIRRYIDSYYKTIIYFHLYLLELGMLGNLLILNWLYTSTGTNPSIEDPEHVEEYNNRGWLKVSSIHKAYWKNLEIEFKRRYSSKKSNTFLAPLTIFVDINYPDSYNNDGEKDEFSEVLCASVRPIIEDKISTFVEAMAVDPPPSVIYGGPSQNVFNEEQPPPIIPSQDESPKRLFSLHHRKPKKTGNDAASTFTVESEEIKSNPDNNSDEVKYKKVSSFFYPPK
ncbi:hypothetical protein DFJ63DRAFT_338530 [Scheffersomyces coipomensis]|uniref:uncharacterized protein n=1 Tax=Scheffersomyces coipomensis TaxID=1788519 RepID=UPI00315D5033